MPELTIDRKHTTPPPMVCMYCGAPATSTTEWRVVNRPPEKGGGSGGIDLTPVPTGGDHVSAAIAVVMLPFVLWDLLKGLVAGIDAVTRYLRRPRPALAPPQPPKPQPMTRVVVTACDRHLRFGTRFMWAGLAMALGLAALWAWSVVVTRRAMGTEDVNPAVVLLITAVIASVLLPLVLSAWYAFAGPVTVERVTEKTVVLDRVRQAYFDATGLKPTDATNQVV